VVCVVGGAGALAWAGVGVLTLPGPAALTLAGAVALTLAGAVALTLAGALALALAGAVALAFLRLAFFEASGRRARATSFSVHLAVCRKDQRIQVTIIPFFKFSNSKTPSCCDKTENS